MIARIAAEGSCSRPRAGSAQSDCDLGPKRITRFGSVKSHADEAGRLTSSSVKLPGLSCASKEREIQTRIYSKSIISTPNPALNKVSILRAIARSSAVLVRDASSAISVTVHPHS